MENGSIVEKLASQFSQSASVKNVFGEPVQVGEKTIIPVAQVAYGLGGGHGKGRKKPGKKMNAEPGTQPEDNDVVGEGGGVGGGIYARPKRVYEITPACTRFIPASNTKQLLIAAGIGFLLSRMFRRRKKK